MRSSSAYGNRAGWQAVFDPDAWIAVLVFLTVWVVCLSALACAVALVRETTEHDWYATGKLFVTELMIGIGFDDSVVTEYRDWWGEVKSLTRAELRVNGDARVARRHVLRTATKAAELGACCGLGGALLCFTVFGRQARRQRPRPTLEPPIRPAGDQAQGSMEPPPARERDSGKGAGQTGGQRKRRKRDYGRWI
ncbi:MAG: hypothetical protein OXQ89_11775 [Rhodospirillaceae bacterium]|nr:hypothetical protein [Rhodospirillaceae bacterium]